MDNKRRRRKRKGKRKERGVNGGKAKEAE